MAPARRNRMRRDWPRGLYETRPGYYVWREPGAEGKQHTIGEVEEDDAIHQALMANEHHRKNLRPSLVDRLTGAIHTIAELLKELPVATKKNTLKGNRSLDKKIAAAHGTIQCKNYETSHCAQLIEAEVKAGHARQAQALRARMVVMCQRGLELGWMKGVNVAEQTKRPDAEVTRSRLSLEQFKAIYEVAPQVNDWLRDAMMLALVTGQDRVTVCGMQRSQVQMNEGEKCLVVHRSKTEATNEPFAIPLRLRLDAVGVTLGDLLQQLTTLRSKFYVHHQRPFGNAPVGAAVFPDRVSKAFTEARALAGIPDDIDGKEAPTFHEIRSLSKRLYDKQGGVDTKMLLGHASEEASALYAKARGSEVRKVQVG